MDINEFNRSVIDEFRANGGKVGGAMAGAPLLLLTTKGAKSGQTRVNPLAYPRGSGPSLFMFGRLAPGATLAQAQSEFATIAPGITVPHPEIGSMLRPMVTPFTMVIEDPSIQRLMRIGQLFVAVLTVVVAINLAILVYARTVTRLGEIAIRSALAS